MQKADSQPQQCLSWKTGALTTGPVNPTACLLLPCLAHSLLSTSLIGPGRLMPLCIYSSRSFHLRGPSFLLPTWLTGARRPCEGLFRSDALIPRCPQVELNSFPSELRIKMGFTLSKSMGSVGFSAPPFHSPVRLLVGCDPRRGSAVRGTVLEPDRPRFKSHRLHDFGQEN